LLARCEIVDGSGDEPIRDRFHTTNLIHRSGSVGSDAVEVDSVLLLTGISVETVFHCSIDPSGDLHAEALEVGPI
jgi:hypothetical protein